MNYDAVTEQSYYHKNLVAVIIGVVLLAALIVFGVSWHTRTMIDAGYTYREVSPSGWSLEDKKK